VDLDRIYVDFISGSVMLMSEATKMYVNGPFLLKMSLIVFAGINANDDARVIKLSKLKLATRFPRRCADPDLQRRR
jgi:hypothetical protein